MTGNETVYHKLELVFSHIIKSLEVLIVFLLADLLLLPGSYLSDSLSSSLLIARWLVQDNINIRTFLLKEKVMTVGFVFNIYLFILCVCVDMHTPQWACGGHGTITLSGFSPTASWVLENKFKWMQAPSSAEASCWDQCAGFKRGSFNPWFPPSEKRDLSPQLFNSERVYVTASTDRTRQKWTPCDSPA